MSDLTELRTQLETEIRAVGDAKGLLEDALRNLEDVKDDIASQEDSLDELDNLLTKTRCDSVPELEEKLGDMAKELRDIENMINTDGRLDEAITEMRDFIDFWVYKSILKEIK